MTTSSGRQPKKDNSLKWLVIVFLFGIGAWPIALFLLLGWDWLAGKSRKRTSAAKARQAQERMDAAISQAEQQAAHPGGAQVVGVLGQGSCASSPSRK